jgi:DNA-binding CsgD family transcriptional regulator
MKPARLYTPDAVAAFLAMCRDRQPRDLIASRLGWTVRQVIHLHEHLQRRGRQRYRLPYRSRRANRYPSPLAGREAEIAALSRQDFSALQIGELLGVTRSTVANFMHDRGLYALHRRQRRRGRLPVSLTRLTRLARPSAIDEADVRVAERAWAELEGAA